MSEAAEGENYPPIHPNCRCTTIMADPNLSSRNARDPETGKNYKVDGDMTFAEWKNSLTDEQNAAMKNYVDKSAGSGIIKIRGEDMYRKSKDNNIEPMPKKQLHKIEKAFKKNGGTIQYSKEIDAYLESKHAEAITYNAETILLKTNPGRASVFEELIHAAQYSQGKNDGSYISRLNCEIEAQNMLLKNSSAYNLTEREVSQTKEALREYKKELEEYLKSGGVQNV